MFSNAKVPPPTAPSATGSSSSAQKNSGLKKCFQILVDRKQLCLDKDVLKLLMLKELGINMNNLDPKLIDALPYLLTIYMKNWPGWQKSVDYYSGKMHFREWYLRFRQYIILKMNYIIKNGYRDAMISIENEKSSSGNANSKYVEKGSQTDNLAAKGLAPYKISLKCPPEMLNNIVFCSVNNDIILRCHSEIPWNEIATNELVNWSMIEVQFTSPEFIFSRRISHKLLRCVSLVNTSLVHNAFNDKDFIEYANIIDPNIPRQTIPLNILNTYYLQYTEILKKYPQSMITSEYFEEISLIFKAFLLDVEELKVNNSIATNTAIGFNIGSCTYTRNKKITRSTPVGHCNEIGYIEYITPRCELSLIAFKPQVDTNGNFTYLKFLSDNLQQFPTNSVPKIVYNCIYCNLVGMDKSAVMNHLRMKHKMEQCVLCIVCKKQFQIYELASKRWCHNCITKSS